MSRHEAFLPKFVCFLGIIAGALIALRSIDSLDGTVDFTKFDFKTFEPYTVDLTEGGAKPLSLVRQESLNGLALGLSVTGFSGIVLTSLVGGRRRV